MDPPPPDYSEHPQQLTDIDLKLWFNFAQGDNLLFNNAEAVSRRMGMIGERLFCGTRTAMQVEFWDVKLRGSVLGRKVVTETTHDHGSMMEYLKENSVIGIRTISMHANSPGAPISITAEAMNALLTYLRVGPQFLDLLFSFAGHGKSVEAGMGSLVYKSVPNGPNVAGIIEVQYILRYPSLSPDGTWVISQTAVYHRHVLRTPGNLPLTLYLSLLPSHQNRQLTFASSAKRQFLDLASLSTRLTIPNPSSYIGEWRWFLLDLEKEIEALDAAALTLLSHSQSESLPARTHIQLTIHALHRRLAPLTPILRSTLETVKNLGVIAGKMQKMGDEFRAYEVQIEGYLGAVEGLRERVERLGKMKGL
ncbi:hypothetical protein IFR04_002761 [Cadophora malorum]|uniref:CorA-like transporter domain-containing protein n=1 Tax=Cadophora malorum TaxID=108018 RepID=A0A8H7WFU8_9HELO|nr:hypothetical protein IFR04_002761 [Cadophora malorum]